MGQEQANIECNDPRSCPPLLDMMGCHRPKIYAIICQLFRNHTRLVEITEDTYSTIFRNMKTQDKVRFYILLLLI